jgi:hypothetical protein
MPPRLATILRAHDPGIAIINAIKRLLSEDNYLFERDVNERSITHRLACHLQSEFTGWHVDCEYNRDINSDDHINFRKKLYNLPLKPNSDDTEGKTVFPDIIIHKRGTTDNHLVIEVKKAHSTVHHQIDLDKLKGYKDELHYTHALFLVFDTDVAPSLTCAKWV